MYFVRIEEQLQEKVWAFTIFNTKQRSLVVVADMSYMYVENQRWSSGQACGTPTLCGQKKVNQQSLGKKETRETQKDQRKVCAMPNDIGRSTNEN